MGSGRWAVLVGAVIVMLAVWTGGAPAQDAAGDEFLVVDCLLPGQVRQLGTRMTYVAARRAIKTSARDCAIRGGEYVAYDRADYRTALKTWLPAAEEGDPEAQVYVGEIFEKGLGLDPDPAAAAVWYLKAAEQGNRSAMLNLGHIFENGLGLPRDPEQARMWYRRAAGIDGLDFDVGAPSQPAPGSEAGPVPEIMIIEPEVTKTRNGDLRFRLGRIPERLVIVGQVDADAAIREVTVNGATQELIGGQMFRAVVDGATSLAEITVAARDATGQTGELHVRLRSAEGGVAATAPEASLAGPLPDLGTGRNHALVIGNNAYDHVISLDTAVNDARVIARVLEAGYGFSVTLLEDVGRYEVLSALNELRQQFGPEDRLLIYYAGHGELDRINDRGHWLPVDAEADNPANWVSNIAITDMLNAMPAGHVLVIADSCYSGTMSRGALSLVDPALDPAARAAKLEQFTERRSRVVMTSGGIAPVLDNGGDGHSVFARALIDALERNQGAITGAELFDQLAPAVEQAAAAIGFDQVPEYAPLRYAGHEAGDFLFVRQR